MLTSLAVIICLISCASVLNIIIITICNFYQNCNGVYITNLLIVLVEALVSSDSDLVLLSRHIVDWESIAPVLYITEAEEIVQHAENTMLSLTESHC